MKNAFGQEKFEPKDIFTDEKVANSLELMFEGWLSYLGVANCPEVIERTFESFKK